SLRSSSSSSASPRHLHSFPTRRSSDLPVRARVQNEQRRPPRVSFIPVEPGDGVRRGQNHFVRHFKLHQHRVATGQLGGGPLHVRSEEHTSELQSRENLVCRLLLEKKNK